MVTSKARVMGLITKLAVEPDSARRVRDLESKDLAGKIVVELQKNQSPRWRNRVKWWTEGDEDVGREEKRFLEDCLWRTILWVKRGRPEWQSEARPTLNKTKEAMPVFHLSFWNASFLLSPWACLVPLTVSSVWRIFCPDIWWLIS